MRKTKIVCTLGPAVDDESVLEQLMFKGMDIARVNFSHDSHELHKTRVDRFKKVRDKMDKPIPLLLDTKGPEIRTGKFEPSSVTLEQGQAFSIINEDIVGDKTKATVTYKNLYNDVSKGSRILINDGLVELEVESVECRDIHCRVLNGGTIGNNKGINVPGAQIHLPALTEQDISDIRFGVENGFDFIAASFVRKAGDVVEIKKVLESCGGEDLRVIAKIENREGIQNFDEILKVADGIMVARGDLGVEIPVEEVPVVQKKLIEKCYRAGKPVITATQMLDSMIRNPRPTRAEASDVANAIFDGTSAIMLSGETAMGKYPVETLETMGKIAESAESNIDYWHRFSTAQFDMATNVTNAISHATCTTALDLKAAAVITVTQSGTTAKMVSRFRPACPIIATTVSERVRRQLSLSWGVIPYLVKEVCSTDEIFELGVNSALESGLVSSGDLVVITAGVPVGISGTTNILKVHLVGKVLVKGRGVGVGNVTGEVVIARSAAEANEKVQEGCILVAPFTNNEMMAAVKKAGALIVEENGVSSHAATVGMALEIPVITGAENATQLLKSGTVVTVDAERGLVRY